MLRSAIVALAVSGIMSTAALAGNIEITRGDAVAAFNAIGAIGQYKTAVKQGGQEVPVDKFLAVSPAMRSTLIRNAAALKPIVMDTLALQENAKRRLGDSAELAAEIEKIAQTIVPADVVLFTEADLQLAENPQITPLVGMALSPLVAKK